MQIEQHILGFSKNDEAVILYEMRNSHDNVVRVINIGAAVVSIDVPDRDGNRRDVALGFRMFEDYFGDPAYIGKTAGRYANRIAKGRFLLDGREYTLNTNNGMNHLHGGPNGFSEVVWNSRVETDRVVFSYTSIDGDEGYPGELNIEIVYDWDDNNQLEITFFAASEAKTIINLTNHAYFNLNGDGSGSILSHEIKLNASKYIPTDSTNIPTGEILPVVGTPMDFTTFKSVGRDIDADFEQLRFGAGYDHCYVIDNWEKGVVSKVGELYSPESGIVMTIESSQPGVQIYSGNYLAGNRINKTGKHYVGRDGIALECQNFPDAPNKSNFPDAVLDKGELYNEKIVYQFSTK